MPAAEACITLAPMKESRLTAAAFATPSGGAGAEQAATAFRNCIQDIVRKSKGRQQAAGKQHRTLLMTKLNDSRRSLLLRYLCAP